MVINHKWRSVRGWAIRINAAWRCLRKKQYVLVCWDKCEDGDVDFKISHKGADLPTCIHRLKVDAVDILQDMADQESALIETGKILSPNNL
jgi:hypothetical protein